jgi:hypothetical protein
MALLREVLQAAREDLWRQMTQYTVHMSFGGAFFRSKCGSSQLKDLVVEGSTRQQSLEINGFCGVGQRAHYRPGWVALEGPDGQLLEERKASPQQLRERLKSSSWDALELAYYCGYSTWNYIAVPFIFAEPDVTVEELQPDTVWRDGCRRLRARFPPRIATHGTEQTFYFDRDGLLRRQDYVDVHDSTRIAQLFSGHQRFSGVLIPTLGRTRCIAPDGVSLAKPSLVDVEVFDVVFR